MKNILVKTKLNICLKLVIWLKRFRKRHEITFRNISGKASQVTCGMAFHRLSLTLSAISNDYAAKDIFNADEFGLFFRSLTEKTLTFKEDPCHWGKQSKKCLTVLFNVITNNEIRKNIELVFIVETWNLQCQ